MLGIPNSISHYLLVKSNLLFHNLPYKMKFTLAVITALTGLAIANPVSSPNNNNAAEGLLEKRCKGGDEHCKRDSQCCSVSYSITALSFKEYHADSTFPH